MTRVSEVRGVVKRRKQSGRVSNKCSLVFVDKRRVYVITSERLTGPCGCGTISTAVDNLDLILP